MEDALIDNIFVLFGGLVFQQTTCILMGTNCAPLVAEMFLHACGRHPSRGCHEYKIKKLAQIFNSRFFLLNR